MDYFLLNAGKAFPVACAAVIGAEGFVNVFETTRLIVQLYRLQLHVPGFSNVGKDRKKASLWSCRMTLTSKSCAVC